MQMEITQELPMQMGSGSVDPELIEPHEPEIDTEDLIAPFVNL